MSSLKVFFIIIILFFKIDNITRLQVFEVELVAFTS